MVLSNTSDDNVSVTPVNRLHGELRLPGDKSISHRAALIASLARGKSALQNFSTAQDCQATLECLKQLGVQLVNDGSNVVIAGVGANGFKQPEGELNAQNSGTTMRLLAGILAGQNFTSTITGDESLRSRPMLRLAEPLRLMGAKVELGPNDCAPVRITGQHPLKSIRYQPTIASAQLKSAVLLAGLTGDCDVTIKEQTRTRDHTELLLQTFGSSLNRTDNQIVLSGNNPLRACDVVIPGDVSSAAFFIAAAIALPGSNLVIHEVGLNPTRTAFLSKLTELGADINIANKRPQNGEPAGNLEVSSVPLKNKLPIVVAGSEVSSLIDELPLLAFLAAGIGCAMELRDAAELRVKECDRITATVENLKRMGALIVARDDGWSLAQGSQLHGAELNSFGDHRIAMSCAVAALTAEGSSNIEGGRGSVAVSLPEFWNLLEKVSG
ncbi:MAG TPA: 3-phosphoshikimate 1-carboxyvinyltransferase [Pyrinomonadaceae bacterium]|nr:3-phosphoshikimate 1-carboxyvinyltransferase [Pyrinomonadaceae bacterium]